MIPIVSHRVLNTEAGPHEQQDAHRIMSIQILPPRHFGVVVRFCCREFVDPDLEQHSGGDEESNEMT